MDNVILTSSNLDDLNSWLFEQGLDDLLENISSFLDTDPMIYVPDNSCDYRSIDALNRLRCSYVAFATLQSQVSALEASVGVSELSTS